MITKLKVRLVEIPKIKKDPEDPKSELVNFGSFTLNKKYTAVGLYSSDTVTQFLVADDSGIFLWVSTAVFRSA